MQVTTFLEIVRPQGPHFVVAARIVASYSEEATPPDYFHTPWLKSSSSIIVAGPLSIESRCHDQITPMGPDRYTVIVVRMSGLLTIDTV